MPPIMAALHWACALAILTGALAPASPFVLERVEITRLQFGGHLTGPGVVRLAVHDCALLGRRGWMAVEGRGIYLVYVVDCQQKCHVPLAELGLAADVDRAELGHREAVIVLR